MFLALLVLGLASFQGQDSRPLESGLVRSIELESPPGTTVQHFRLEAEDGSGDPLGLARYVAGPDGKDGYKVELELCYFEGDLRLIHTERTSPFGRRLVFREVRGDGGRTLFLSGSALGGWECQELGGPEALRRRFPAGGELPLFLVETARQGLPVPASAAVFDALGARFEPCLVVAEPGRFELRSSAGDLRFAVELSGETLLGWRWQPGAPVARAVPAEEYEALRAAHAAPRAAQAAAPRGAGF